MKNIFLKIRYYAVCVIIAIALFIMIMAWHIFPEKYHKKIRNIWGRSQILLFRKPIIEGELCEDTTLCLLNHRSALDIMVIESFTTQDLAWVGKKSLKEMPFFGQIITTGRMMVIDRESKTSMLSMISQSKQKLKEGRVITIFPEGTRGQTHKMLDFQAGAETLANILKLKVQPIVLTNTREVLDLQNGTFDSKPQIRIKILPQVQADKKTNWMEKLRKDMQDNLDELAELDNHR